MIELSGPFLLLDNARIRSDLRFVLTGNKLGKIAETMSLFKITGCLVKRDDICSLFRLKFSGSLKDDASLLDDAEIPSFAEFLETNGDDYSSSEFTH